MALPGSCPNGNARASQSICRTPEKSTAASILEGDHPADDITLDVMACNRSGSAGIIIEPVHGFLCTVIVVFCAPTIRLCRRKTA